MSYNDLVSTGLGGIAVGEQMYRFSGQLLDNQAGGVGRILRETGAFLINPVRGFNRALRAAGRQTIRIRRSPSTGGVRKRATSFPLGVRIIGEGESISENTNTYSYLALNHSFGSVWDNSRRKPFDSLAADYQFSFGDKQPRTVLRIRGDIFSKAFGGKSDAPTYAFAVVQHFDYHNNNAFEFGQQAFGPSLVRALSGSPTAGASASGGTVGPRSWPP